jgi:hypothetical protein
LRMPTSGLLVCIHRDGFHAAHAGAVYIGLMRSGVAVGHCSHRMHRERERDCTMHAPCMHQRMQELYSPHAVGVAVGHFSLSLRTERERESRYR